MAVFNLVEPVPGFGVVHVGSLERLPGTFNGTEPLLMSVVPPVLCLLRLSQNVCEKVLVEGPDVA